MNARDGRQHDAPRPKNTHRKAAGVDAVAERAGAILRRDQVSRGDKSEMRFRDLVESALEAKQLRGNEASSIHTDRVRLRRILPAIGHLKIGQLTSGRIERFLQDLARGDESYTQLKGATINSLLKNLVF